MKTWIFQATPDDFKIDEFIAARPSECLWRASRHSKEIAIGDRVFLWRAMGKSKSEAGIFGRAKVLEEARVQPPGTAQRDYWKKAPDQASKEPRVLIGDVELLNSKLLISRNSLIGDPLARNLSILRMAQGTNFRTTGDEAVRLELLWQYIGQPWSQSELVVVFRAFEESGWPDNGELNDAALRSVATLVGRPVSSINARVRIFAGFERSLSLATPIGKPLERAVWAEGRKSDAGTVP